MTCYLHKIRLRKEDCIIVQKKNSFPHLLGPFIIRPLLALRLLLCKKV